MITLNDEEHELSEDGGLEESMDDGPFGRNSERVMDDSSSTGKNDIKEEDEIMEGDIVVVTPPSTDGFVHSKSKPSLRPVVIHYPRSISLKSLPESGRHQEKERRAVVVKLIGSERVGIWDRSDV